MKLTGTNGFEFSTVFLVKHDSLISGF